MYSFPNTTKIELLMDKLSTLLTHPSRNWKSEFVMENLIVRKCPL